VHHTGGKSTYKAQRISDGERQFTSANPRGIRNGNAGQTLCRDTQRSKVRRVIAFANLRFKFAPIPQLHARM
jgi:hypothetical protein